MRLDPIRLIVRAALAALFLYALISAPGLASRWGVSAGGIVLLVGWSLAAVAGVRVLGVRPGWPSLAGLVLVAAALRIGAAWVSDGRVSSGDPHAYIELAGNLVRDGDFGVYEPFFRTYCRAMYPPLYPLLLAGWGALFGFSTGAILLLGTIIDAATAALIAILGRRLGSNVAGCRAAWLYLVWPSVVLSAPLAQKEGLCALLVLALALAWLDDRRGWRGAVALGAPAGLLALTQPGQAPLAMLIGLVLWRHIGFANVVKRGLAAMPLALLVMLPWWVRNWLVFGVFMPLTSAGGASLWVGNNAHATGNWLAYPPQMRDLPERAIGKRAGELAMAWIRSDPLGFVRLTITKFVRACGAGIFGIVRLEAMTLSLPKALLAALWPVSHLSHAALLALSAWRMGRAPVILVLLVAACGLQLMLFGVWFEFGERHRDFATPFLLLLLCWPALRVAKGNPSLAV